jgi:sulfonate transport system substrate-binding protein
LSQLLWVGLGFWLAVAAPSWAAEPTEADRPLTQLVHQLSLPRAIPPRVLETVGLFIGGICFAIALDRWFARPAAHRGNTLLVQQARRLKQLKMGYPEGMTNLEVLRQQGWLEEKLGPFGVQVTWSSYLSASDLIEALSSGVIAFCGGGSTANIFSQAADHVFVRVAKKNTLPLRGKPSWYGKTPRFKPWPTSRASASPSTAAPALTMC